MLQIPSLMPFLKRNIPFAIGVLVFLFLTCGFIYADQLLRVTNVMLLSKEQKEHPIIGLEYLESKNLWLLSLKDSEVFIKKSNPYVKEVTLVKQYPDTVRVKVQYYKPLAYLHLKEGYILLGENGVVLQKMREKLTKLLPEIKYYQHIAFSRYQAGDDVGIQEIEDSIFYLQKLTTMKIHVNSIDITSFSMLGLYTNEGVFVFSSEKERKEQEYQLEVAMHEFRISGKRIESLDVRFDKPVVVFGL